MSDKKKHRTANELLQYLKGAASGKERHSLEREMEADPFLQEAMEGFEQVTPEEAEADLVALHQSLRRRRSRKRRRAWYSMAAAIASILIVGTLFLKIYDIHPAGGEKRELLEEAAPGELPAVTEQVPAQTRPAAGESETEQIQPPIGESEPVQLQPEVEEPETDQFRVTADVPEPVAKGIQAEQILAQEDMEMEVLEEKEPALQAPAEPQLYDQPREERTAPIQPGKEAVRARRNTHVLEKIAAPVSEAPAAETERVDIVTVEAAAATRERGKGEPIPYPNEISGTVVSAEDHSPVTGAFLSVNGAEAISVSDMEGRFSIPVSRDTQTLISVRFPGMEEQKITVPAEEPVRIMLQPEILPARDKSLYAVKEASEADDTGQSGLQPRSTTPAGGYIAFYQYIKENRRIPPMEQAGSGGVVILKFKINTLGEITEIVPVGSPGEPFTEEAIRLLKEGPRWIPAFDDTGTIDQEVTLRIVLE